jgi:formylglycine-generating enzyme required for sulfatase activity
MQFVLISEGHFVMGSPVNEPERGNNEFMHPVTIGLPLLLGVHPVTQFQYQQVMGVNPSSYSPTGLAQTEVAGLDTRNFPVEWVSWLDAVEFCNRLSAFSAERAAGRVYRLPDEAEWEYACRASTPTVFAFGNSLTSQQANFNGGMPYGTTLRGPNLQRPSIVGAFRPNAWGLYDMHGNVWEWCNDLYCPRHDRRLATATKRTIRGGTWKAGARACRSASRQGEKPEQRNGQIGFRVAMQVR